MIPGTSDTTLTVLISIDTFLINDNIGNGGDACKSKQKDHNLAVGRQETIARSAGGAVAWRTIVVLFAVNSNYKPIKSTHLWLPYSSTSIIKTSSIFIIPLNTKLAYAFLALKGNIR